MRRASPLRSRSLPFALLCATSLACSGSDHVFTPATPTTHDWEPSGGQPAELAIDDPEPFDVRLASMYPETVAGRERICDLTFVGMLHGLRRDEHGGYDPPVSHRVTVRCRAATGEGWGDLVFPKIAASLAPYVRTGSRVRVKLRGHSGFEGYPVMEFVAQLGDAAPEPPRRRLVVPVGSDFATVSDGLPRPCAIASVGSVQPIPGAEEASHHMLVTCRHPTGARTVDVRFPRASALAALRFSPGEVVPLRPTASDGPHLTAVYTGP
jgi:hypothetical protein